jgi:multimeric flavodoxin WrbA
MKVLMINGSPHLKGNTRIALNEMVKIFDQENIETEIVNIGQKDIRGCIACMSCKQGLNKCIFNDIVDYYGVAEQSFRF